MERKCCTPLYNFLKFKKKVFYERKRRKKKGAMHIYEENYYIYYDYIYVFLKGEKHFFARKLLT